MARESHTFHSLAKAFPQIQRRRSLSSCLSVPSNAKPRHRLAVKGIRYGWRVLQDKDFGLGTNARRTRRQAWSRGGAASAASKRGGGASGRAYQHMCSSIAMGWLPFPCTKSALQTNFAQKEIQKPVRPRPSTTFSLAGAAGRSGAWMGGSAHLFGRAAEILRSLWMLWTRPS